jgi:hypothetical protein
VWILGWAGSLLPVWQDNDVTMGILPRGCTADCGSPIEGIPFLSLTGEKTHSVTHVKLNVVVKVLTLLLRISEFPHSNLGTETRFKVQYPHVNISLLLSDFNQDWKFVDRF